MVVPQEKIIHLLNRCDKAGIQIRGEDGVLDGQGNIAGHGTDPTGKVGDIAALAKAVKALSSVTVLQCKSTQTFNENG